MNDDGFKVHINRFIPDRFGMGITFYEKRGRDMWVAKPVELVMEPYDMKVAGYSVRPTLVIDHYYEPEFLKALAEAISEQGVRTDSDHKLIGTLEATKYHLEDLRRLLKLTTKPQPDGGTR